LGASSDMHADFNAKPRKRKVAKGVPVFQSPARADWKHGTRIGRAFLE
jgi:hypothetical protein